MDQQHKDALVTQWGEGPWNNEPDGLEGIHWDYKGYKCEVKRNTLGSWCGYVVIPKTHPICKGDRVESLDMHGGITYSSDEEDHIIVGFDCAHYRDVIPYIVAVRKSKDYKEFVDEWLSKNEELRKNSFLRELLKEYTENRPDIYRTYSYVRKECESVVKQLIKYRE